MNICERFPYPYECAYFTCSYLGRIFSDLNILHILFSAGGQGMPFMAWLRVWVHKIRGTAKKHRNQFRTASSGDGRRERKRKSFVPEPVSCISDSLCLFHIPVSGYVTHRVETAMEVINHRRFINEFPPDIIKSMLRLERIYSKKCRPKDIYIV